MTAPATTTQHDGTQTGWIQNIAGFATEARTHLDAIEPDLMVIERDGPDARSEHTTNILRAIQFLHAANERPRYEPFEALCTAIERTLVHVLACRITHTTQVTDALITAVDTLRQMLEEPQPEGFDETLQALHHILPQPDLNPTQETLERTVEAIRHATFEAAPGTTRPEKSAAAETLRIRVDLLTNLMNLAGELVLGRNQLMRALAGEARESGLGAILQNISQVTTSLQEGIMQTRMQPAEAIFNRFPRIIRDVSKQLGKRIELEIVGSEVELDKSLVELLTDPLTHIIRNSADHAIELPEERRAAGKDETGHITLKACHQDGQVNISIHDDGRGIDPSKVRRKALDKGLITSAQAEHMTERELVHLIFTPGFSTMEAVSELSGRGVGMDVVRSNTEKMGGTVEIDTTLGRGTTVLLRLPLTLAIIPSMIVGVGAQRFAIPQVHVVEFVSVQADDLATRIERIQNSEVLRLRDRLLPLVHLASVLSIEPTPRTATGYDIVVLQIGSNHFGVVVDELFDIEEIVVKPVSAFAQGCRCFSGATIVGDGRVIMILDVGGLVTLATLQFADLKAENERRVELENQRAAITASRLLPILLCTGAPDEYLAIPQDSILRLEMFPTSAIQRVGRQEFVNYRGHGLPLIRLDRHINVRPIAPELTEIFVVIPKTLVDGKVTAAQAGIVISSILDALDADVDLEPIDLGGPGVLGSAILNNNLTLFLQPADIFAAAQTGASR